MRKADKRQIESDKHFFIKRACRTVCAAARAVPVTSVRLEPPKSQSNFRDWRMTLRARRERAEREARKGVRA